MPRTPRKGQRSKAASKCGGRCWYCGMTPDPGDITVDHAKPRSRGGQNFEDNLLPACMNCNNEKGPLTVSEFRKWVKVRVIRNLMSLGLIGGDLSQIKIQFFGESGEPPFGY